MDQANGLRKIINAKANQAAKQFSKGAGTKSSSPGIPRVIAVTSGKGGVGKTNIVGNLAVACAKMGKRVLIFDADLGLANIDIIFGVNPEYNIGDVLSGEMSLKDIMVEGPSGIKIIPAGSGFVNLTNLTQGQKMGLLSEFEALDDILDVFFIDTGAGISTNVLYFNLAADECIVVATTEPTSITDAYAIMKIMAKEYGAKRFKLIVNMVKSEREAKVVFFNLSQALERFLNGVVVEYMGCIPYDNNLQKSVLKRQPVMNLFPDSSSSKVFQQIAAGLLRTPTKQPLDGNIKFFVKRFLEYNVQ